MFNVKSKPVVVEVEDGSAEFSIPMAGDLARLLDIQELTTVTVHGLALLIDRKAAEDYLSIKSSTVTTMDELAEALEKTVSLADAERIHGSQLQARLSGAQFEFSSLGELEETPTDEYKVILPIIKTEVKFVEVAADNLSSDGIEDFIQFLPPESEEEIFQPKRCIGAPEARAFLSNMQLEEEGLSLNDQLKIYNGILVRLKDDDPTKVLALTMLRSLMVYADVVSNKDLRLALTEVILTNG